MEATKTATFFILYFYIKNNSDKKI